MISGLGLNLEASWDQKRGIEPRICTTELILPLLSPASSSRISCSVSTSFATRPRSFTPLFRYLQYNVKMVTAKEKQRRATTIEEELGNTNDRKN